MKVCDASYRACKMAASCHVKDVLSAMTMLFLFLEIKKKLKQAGNNW